MIVDQDIECLQGEKYAAADPEAPIRLLQNPKTAAVALLPACKAIAGNFLAWEPESIWQELTHRGIDLPDENRVKILAAMTLHLVPSFYWDGIVYEKTALAFDHDVPNPEALEEASVRALAWAVKEAAWIRRWLLDAPFIFESEPCVYTAVVLQREGFLVAPTQLVFAQSCLDRLSQDNAELTREVKKRWKALDKEQLEGHAFQETPEDVQLARLASVELHVRDQEKAAKADLKALK
jgi:hypothetical protein